jgi:hypothetical protein
MPIDPSEAGGFERFGIALKDDDGNAKAYWTEGEGSPVGQAAPLTTLYADSTSGELWQKFGAGNDDWRKIGDSFANAADFENAFEDSTSSTTSNRWVTKLDFTTNEKEGGRYYLGWSLEAGQSDKQKQVGTRVQIDDGTGFETMTDIRNGLSADNQYELRSGFRILDNLPANPSGYRIRVQFGQTDSGGSGRIRNVGVIIYRLGD